MKNTKKLEEILKNFDLNDVVIEEIEETGKAELSDQLDIDFEVFMNAINNETEFEAYWNPENTFVIIK